MSHMNIYWEASGIPEKDKQTQIALDQKAKFLRHILIEAQTLGNVPRPVFVKDFSVARQKQVDEILHQISLENQNEPDVSEDTDREMNEDLSSSETDSETELDVHLEKQNVMSSEKELDSNIHEDQSLENVETEFRQDLYDLQHDVLMKKVTLAKTSAIQRPSVVPDTKCMGSDYIHGNNNLKTKFFSPKKLVSKKKLLKQIEQEEMYQLEYEINKFDEMYDNEEIDKRDEEKDFTKIDSYIERYHKVSPTEEDKPE
ncbi:uncharacterized protein LOC123549358 [Mercenaria mercenaria]|uniref:uncharacterized protein LOC123549358 n=1 Tax=Mercenaria mercenaria TaxID=6596 RepID=UPI00234F8179|nr:uncharacterized protein LOC123549358 [Mercenaria mercenaria]